MDYKSFTNDLFQILGLEKNIFDFDLSKLKYNDLQIKVSPETYTNNAFVPVFEYKENENQNWVCVTLFVPFIRHEDFILALNTLLEKYFIKTVDSKTEKEFERSFNNIAFLTSRIKTMQFKIDRVERDYIQVDIANCKS